MSDHNGIEWTDDLPARGVAREINRAHEDVCKAASRALKCARRAGDLLLEAKAQVSHGAWLP
jgi:hypothetical protein